MAKMMPEDIFSTHQALKLCNNPRFLILILRFNFSHEIRRCVDNSPSLRHNGRLRDTKICQFI